MKLTRAAVADGRYRPKNEKISPSIVLHNNDLNLILCVVYRLSIHVPELKEKSLHKIDFQFFSTWLAATWSEDFSLGFFAALANALCLVFHRCHSRQTGEVDVYHQYLLMHRLRFIQLLNC